MVSCPACGCGFADVPAATAYYDAYYARAAKYANEPATSTPSPVAWPGWVEEKADRSARRVGNLLASPDARILDVGCATGALLAALGRAGFHELHGIDPAPGSVHAARARPGLRVEVGSIGSLPPELGTFDCICLTGVLEHLWDVDESLRSLGALLRPGGIVYVEVPDASRYLDPYVAPFEDFNTEHVNHFSPSCLRRLAARHGLRTLWDASVEVALAPGVDTAVVAAAWSVEEGVTPTDVRDDGLEASLRRYASRSSADFERIGEELEDSLGPAGELILWGIGEQSFKLLAVPAMASRVVSAFVDGNPARRAFTFGGTPVGAPGDVIPGEVPIVISSLLRAGSIHASIERLGLPNRTVRLDGWRG